MRGVALAIGLAGLGLVWLYPLESFAGGHFTAHMLRHMTLVALAAPLLVLGASVLRGPAWLTPLVASLFEFVVVWAWHLPLLHDAARLARVPFALEQLAFLLAGLAVWGSVLRPGQALAGAGALLLTSMHMTLLGALIVLAPAPLYLGTGAPTLALDDQRLGGLVMLAIGTPVYLVGGLALVRQALAERAATPAPIASAPSETLP